jgi:hypothetical protein
MMEEIFNTDNILISLEENITFLNDIFKNDILIFIKKYNEIKEENKTLTEKNKILTEKNKTLKNKNNELENTNLNNIKIINDLEINNRKLINELDECNKRLIILGVQTNNENNKDISKKNKIIYNINIFYNSFKNHIYKQKKLK